MHTRRACACACALGRTRTRTLVCAHVDLGALRKLLHRHRHGRVAPCTRRFARALRCAFHCILQASRRSVDTRATKSARNHVQLHARTIARARAHHHHLVLVRELHSDDGLRGRLGHGARVLQLRHHVCRRQLERVDGARGGGGAHAQALWWRRLQRMRLGSHRARRAVERFVREHDGVCVRECVCV
eukprot:6174334-Pleurochrysis_carterae.AAC.1